MTNIRTLDDLQQSLDEEFAWRKKELHSLKFAVEKKQVTESQRDTAIRAGVAMLYAHWEGFIRKAAGDYLDYVAAKKLRNDQLSLPMLALSAASAVDRSMHSEKAEARHGVARFFAEEMASRSKGISRRRISTKSNLNSDVLREIVTTLGLDYSPFATREKLLDESLLTTRNKIAHGHYLLMDAGRFVEVHGLVLQMLQNFADQIIEAAATKAYSRATQP